MATLSRLTDGSLVADGPYTTASISPAANSLILLGVVGVVGSGTPVITSVAGGGMTTWTEVTTVVWAATGRRLSVYRALQASPGTGTITITWDIAMSGCMWFVHQWSEVSLGGVNGAGAIVQSGVQNTTGTSTSISLSAFASALNFAHLYTARNVFFEGLTAGSGMTTEGNVGFSGTTFSDAYGVNQPTPSGSWTSSVAFGSIAMEIASVTPQTLRPDADNVTTGWTATPLWSKVEEAVADGTVITSTAS